MSGARTAPRGLIFDLDGTLVDSFADIATALNRTRVDFGLESLSLDAVRREVGSGAEALVRRLVPGDEPHVVRALRAFVTHYEATPLEQTHIYPGVCEVLDHFAARPLAVVTNKPLHLTRTILRGLGLWERFRIVLGGDSLLRRKPDPLPLHRVLECFALRPQEALMVGDGLHDLHAGRAAGVPTVGVATGVASREVLEAEGATRVIDRIDELLHLYE